MKKASKSKVASVYGLAIYQATKDPKKTYQEIKKLIGTISTDEEFITFLSNPLLDAAVKADAIKKLKLSDVLTNSLIIISQNNHANSLIEILKEFVLIYYKNNNILEVEISSTYELKKAQLSKIEKKLNQKLKKEIIINNVISPEILGGLVIRYGSYKLDSSVLGKLQNIEKLMKGETI